jgi:hypothetical protein
VRQSIQLYWATGPILLMLSFLGLQLKYKFSWGIKVLIFLYATNGIIIISHYIYKISHPF